MEEVVTRKVNNSDQTLQSSEKHQLEEEWDTKVTMKRLTGSSRKMNRERSMKLSSNDAPSEFTHPHLQDSTRLSKTRELQESTRDVVKPSSARPLSPKFDQADDAQQGTSRRLSPRNTAPRSSRKSVSWLGTTSDAQDLGDLSVVKRSRGSSRSPPRSYRNKSESALSPPPGAISRLNYAHEATMTKYGTPRPRDAGNSHPLENDPLGHQGQGGLYDNTHLDRIYSLEHDLRIKSDDPGMESTHATEDRSDQDSVFSSIPPPPELHRDMPLQPITRRVTKDSRSYASTSLQPGAYRAGAWDSSSDDDDDDMTYSERLMTLSESERHREQERELEVARNHSMSCQSLQLSQALTSESATQPSGLGGSTFLDEDTRPEEVPQLGRKRGMSSASCCGIVVVVVLVVCVVVGLVVGLTRNHDSQTTGSNGGSESQDCVYDLKLAEQCQEHGIVSETPACVQSRYQAMQKQLGLEGIGPMDSCSTDNMGLLSMAAANQQVHMANYVLSSLFYSTAGPGKWVKKANWETRISICEWEGITCRLSCRSSDNSSRICDLDAEEVIGISLNDNGLAGMIPSELGLLSELQTVTLSSNLLTGEVPTALGNLVKMTYLELSQNEIGGSIPSAIALLTNLHEFRMTANKVSGTIPSEVGSMSALVVLDLSVNGLKGQIPSELGNLSSLEHLQLDQNYLSGRIPVELSKCLNLEILTAFQNLLTGIIPSEIGMLTSLSILSMGTNTYDSQKVPTEILNLTLLTELILFDSSLTGELPSELANLSSLRKLEVQKNSLIGSIPTELGLMTTLEVMTIDGNYFDGSVPSEIGSMRSLTSLTLARNQLTGSLPSELGKLTNLQDLILSMNELSGMIPSEVCDLWDHALLRLSEPGMVCADNFYGGALCPNIECCKFCNLLARGGN